MERFRLAGKAAVVTGAARGIGEATAELFEAAGARVARIDLEAGEGIIEADCSSLRPQRAASPG